MNGPSQISLEAHAKTSRDQAKRGQFRERGNAYSSHTTDMVHKALSPPKKKLV